MQLYNDHLQSSGMAKTFALVLTIFFETCIGINYFLLNYGSAIVGNCFLVVISCGFIAGKRFSWYDVSACLCMSIGLILFTLADSSVQPNFNMYGKDTLPHALSVCLSYIQ